MIEAIDNIGRYVGRKDSTIIRNILLYLNCHLFDFTSDWNRTPALPGIYIIINSRSILYIGSSINIKRRIQKHKRKYPESDVIAISEPDPGIRQRIETALISVINPVANKINTLYAKRR
jgi:hypothetical protein